MLLSVDCLCLKNQNSPLNYAVLYHSFTVGTSWRLHVSRDVKSLASRVWPRPQPQAFDHVSNVTTLRKGKLHLCIWGTERPVSVACLVKMLLICRRLAVSMSWNSMIDYMYT